MQQCTHDCDINVLNSLAATHFASKPSVDCAVLNSCSVSCADPTQVWYDSVTDTTHDGLFTCDKSLSNEWQYDNLGAGVVYKCVDVACDFAHNDEMTTWLPQYLTGDVTMTCSGGSCSLSCGDDEFVVPKKRETIDCADTNDWKVR